MPVKFANYIQIGSGQSGGAGGGSGVPTQRQLPPGGVPPQVLTIADDSTPQWLNQPVDFTAYTGGTPPSGAVLMAITVQRNLSFPTAAFGLVLDVAATADMTFPIKEIVSGDTIGNLIVLAGQTIATTTMLAFTSMRGDILRVYWPETVDATAAGSQVSATALR